jgi:two-component system, cell cycle sensor histidine kinase and response regulator CckA
MTAPLRVLIVEDLPADAELAQCELGRALGACEFRRVDTREDFSAALHEFHPDLVVSDVTLPQVDALQVLDLVSRLAPRTPVIVLTGAVDEDTAVTCMKAGAADYLNKDHLARLGQAAKRALDERHVSEARPRGEEAAAWKRRYELFASASRLVFYERCDAEGTVELSASLREVLGVGPEAVGNRLSNLAALLHPDDTARVQAEFAAATRTLAPIDLAYRLRHADGRYLEVHDRAYPSPGDAPGAVHYVGVLEDVTEARRQDETRKHLEAQLRQAQKLEAVGRLAGGIAHDYNNATGVVLGYAEMLKEELSPHDPLLELVDAIILAAQRSVNLTRQLLAFARKQVVKPVVVNLNEVLSNVKGMLGRLIGEDIQLTLQLADGLWNVRADPTQVEQVLANLATNARDAIADVGAITIRTANVSVREGQPGPWTKAAPGDYVVLSFGDSGKGMDAATRERLFEPFFTTKPSGQGTGLGLSTVFGIVEQNGGTISVTSEPGRGTTLSILLPRTGARAAAEETRAAPAHQRGSETVLVVEDEEQLLHLARRALSGQGYKVMAARSCGDAILLSEQHAGAIAALVTDVVMPGMNGRELWERLAARRPGLKVVFMSGYTEDVVVSRGVTDGRGGFLQKPFTGAQLTAALRGVLDA